METENMRIEYRVDTKTLRKLMIDKNIETIGQLADVSGVGRDTISGVLSGQIRPSTAVMDKLIYALDIEPENAGPIFFVPDLRNA